MGCMNSKDDGMGTGADSPTNEAERPLIGAADGTMLDGYDGGVAIVNSGQYGDQTDDQNGLHMSEKVTGGSPHFRAVSGHPNQQSFTVNGQPLVKSYTENNTHSLKTANGFVTSSTPQESEVKSERGNEVMHNLKKAYDWHAQFDSPTQEFLSLMDRLYMECQVHLSNLSSKDDTESRNEADAVVREMVAVRNRWGTKLLPNSICNAFVRERIPHKVEGRQFRIDCAQFFEPAPFYGSQQTDNPGELMKLYRFSVYDLTRNEVVLRYYLERSNVTQLYHVLCFTCDNYRGQVYPYGFECPSYWEVRHHMLQDLRQRLKTSTPNVLNQNFQPQGGPVIIQIP